jgi:hypothetical protein
MLEIDFYELWFGFIELYEACDSANEEDGIVKASRLHTQISSTKSWMARSMGLIQ